MLSVKRAHVHPEVLLDELDYGYSRMLYVGSRYPAEIESGTCIYTPILHGCGEPLDGVTLHFCVHRRNVVNAALEQKWSNHAEGQQSR